VAIDPGSAPSSPSGDAREQQPASVDAGAEVIRAAVHTDGADPARPPGDDPAERAALIAEGAGVPRAWAQGFAALAVLPPPVGFWPEHWQRIIDVTGAFLDRWACEAIRCGWTDLDVFGADRDVPTARFDCMGLVLLLDRCKVVAIDPDGADLVTPAGIHQRFQRRPLPPGTVSLWELRR